MTTRSLFATHLYEGQLDDPALLAELDTSCRRLSEEDHAGRAWSKDKGYRGYTSYASLDDLPHRDPAFGDLVRALNKHVAAFAKDCAFDLGGRKLKHAKSSDTTARPINHRHPELVSGSIAPHERSSARRDGP